jgi:hypothetical protein
LMKCIRYTILLWNFVRTQSRHDASRPLWHRYLGIVRHFDGRAIHTRQ